MTAESSADVTDPSLRPITPLYGADFAADPHRCYERLRQQGPVAPVELAPHTPAFLVTGYRLALDVLRDPDTFTKDSRRWQRKMPEDCPVLPIMGYRPNANYASGAEHARLRGSITDSLRRLDPSMVRGWTERSANQLIDRVAGRGEADLLADYARVLPPMVLNQIFGCPDELSRRMVSSLVAIFDAVDNEEANQELARCVFELVALKREQPGADVTSWLLEHPACLTNEEMAHQVIMMIGAGCEPQQNLIANALRLLLVDERFAGDLSGGNLPVEDALDEVLWADPPLANFAATYPVVDVELGGRRVPADEPVLISLAAANNDPCLGGKRTGNRAHLAWGGGPHVCPAQNVSRLIATSAIETLLDRLPDVELAVDPAALTWRPGPFHRALTKLPVKFPPVSVESTETPGENRWTPSPALTGSISPEPTSTPRDTSFVSGGRPRWWNFLARWWRGQ